MIKETIERLKETLAQSDTGHLPLSCRINLMQEIGDALTVQKIMCECCKKACSGESTFAEDGHTLPCGQRP